MSFSEKRSCYYEKICRFNEKRSRYYEKICRFNKRSRYNEKICRFNETRSRYNDIIEWKKILCLWQQCVTLVTNTVVCTMWKWVTIKYFNLEKRLYEFQNIITA